MEDIGQDTGMQVGAIGINFDNPEQGPIEQGDDVVATDISLFHVAYMEMRTLGYTDEEIAEFLRDQGNLSLVIEFSEATRIRLAETMARELAFD